jgi:hypothetical protein
MTELEELQKRYDDLKERYDGIVLRRSEELQDRQDIINDLKLSGATQLHNVIAYHKQEHAAEIDKLRATHADEIRRIQTAHAGEAKKLKDRS